MKMPHRSSFHAVRCSISVCIVACLWSIAARDSWAADELPVITAPSKLHWIWAEQVDAKGRLIASDAGGRMVRITPPPIGGDLKQMKMEPIALPVGHANGLLWAFNSLYVMVCQEGVYEAATRELLTNIIEPSKVVSDQYAATLIELEDVPAPIAHWQFEDEGNGARDSAGNHHGIIHGAMSREGKSGKGLLFDRSKEHHVAIPHSPDFEIGTFTVSAWVWLTKEPTFSGILGTRKGGEFNFDMKVNTDKVHGDIGDGTRWIDTKINFYKEDVGSNGQGGDLAIQRWFLITFVVDSERKECRLYLDVDRKKTIPFQGEPRLMRTGQTMTIGNTGTNEFMDGVIDDVRIWKHALSDEQVRKLIP